MRFRLSRPFRRTGGSRAQHPARPPAQAPPPERVAPTAPVEPGPEIPGSGAPSVGGVSPEKDDRPSAVPRVVVPRWMQLVLLPLALLGLWSLARAAGTVLLILVAAATFALILNPLVKMLSRRGIPRGLSILLVYLGLLAVF